MNCRCVAAVPPLKRALSNLAGSFWPRRQQAWRRSQGIDAEVLLQLPPFLPDMFHWSRQVRKSWRLSSAALVMRQVEPPRRALTTDQCLRERNMRRWRTTGLLLVSARTVVWVRASSRTREVDGAGGPWATITMQGCRSLSSVVFPNVYFHITTPTTCCATTGVVAGQA